MTEIPPFIAKNACDNGNLHGVVQSVGVKVIVVQYTKHLLSEVYSMVKFDFEPQKSQLMVMDLRKHILQDNVNQ